MRPLSSKAEEKKSYTVERVTISSAHQEDLAKEFPNLSDYVQAQPVARIDALVLEPLVDQHKNDPKWLRDYLATACQAIAEQNEQDAQEGDGAPAKPLPLPGYDSKIEREEQITLGSHLLAVARLQLAQEKEDVELALLSWATTLFQLFGRLRGPYTEYLAAVEKAGYATDQDAMFVLAKGAMKEFSDDFIVQDKCLSVLLFIALLKSDHHNEIIELAKEAEAKHPKHLKGITDKIAEGIKKAQNRERTGGA